MGLGNAITWAKVDPHLSRHMESLGANKLIVACRLCYLCEGR